MVNCCSLPDRILPSHIITCVRVCVFVPIVVLCHFSSDLSTELLEFPVSVLKMWCVVLLLTVQSSNLVCVDEIGALHLLSQENINLSNRSHSDYTSLSPQISEQLRSHRSSSENYTSANAQNQSRTTRGSSTLHPPSVRETWRYVTSHSWRVERPEEPSDLGLAIRCCFFVTSVVGCLVFIGYCIHRAA